MVPLTHFRCHGGRRVGVSGGSVPVAVDECRDVAFKSQATNQRLHARMVEHMGGGGRVELAVATKVEAGGGAVDLNEKAARLMAERDALAQLASRGVPIENL